VLYQLVAPAEVEPILLEDAKVVCVVDADVIEEDAHIERLIAAARDYVQNDLAACGNPLRLALETWQVSGLFWPRNKWIDFSLLPVVSLEAMSYQAITDAGLVEVEMALDEFHLQPGNARVIRWGALQWPDVVLGPDGWRLRFTVGYSPESVPPALYQAMLMLIAHWFENREAVLASSEFRAESVIVPHGYADLVAPFKRARVL